MNFPEAVRRRCNKCGEEKIVALHFAGSANKICKECLNKKNLESYRRLHGRPEQRWRPISLIWKHQRDPRDTILDVE